MKKFFIAIAVMFLSFTAVQAQPYNAAIGLEGGFGGLGLTYKQFTGPNNFIDYKADLDIFHDNLNLFVSGTFDWNVPISGGFQFFYGLGAAAGAWFGDYTALRLGVFGNIGFEYAFSAIPFALSIDWNPGYYATIHDGITGGFGWNQNVACVGLKFTF